MLFGLMYLVGHNIFINTEYVFLSVVPVVTYSDLKVDKKTILKDNNGKSGVYR
jgi:hypothetical protein